jgi:hypothetical protein
MIDKPIDTEFGCEEYCEPAYQACQQGEKDEALCQERHKDCISFCQFA